MDLTNIEGIYLKNCIHYPGVIVSAKIKMTNIALIYIKMCFIANYFTCNWMYWVNDKTYGIPYITSSGMIPLKYTNINLIIKFKNILHNLHTFINWEMYISWIVTDLYSIFLEKLVYKQLTSFQLNEHILYKQQYGFRKKTFPQQKMSHHKDLFWDLCISNLH